MFCEIALRAQELQIHYVVTASPRDREHVIDVRLLAQFLNNINSAAGTLASISG
jgi:hypothetical protein